MRAYYLIEAEYVGPDEKDSGGNWIGDTRHMMEIHSEPGKTNMGREERTEGWLGTTNDWHRQAHGEFESLEAAREAAKAEGFTELKDKGEDEVDESLLETWVSKSAAREQWDAGDWLNGVTYPAKDGMKVSIEGLPDITSKTTDDGLEAMVSAIEGWAEDEGVEIHGTLETLEAWRAWCGGE